MNNDIRNDIPYTTTPILYNGKVMATGFFFSSKKEKPYLITCRHVIIDLEKNKKDKNSRIMMEFKMKNKDNLAIIYKCDITLFTKHPKYDVASLLLSDSHIKDTQTKFLTPDIMKSDGYLLKNMTAMEEVIMLGYPEGNYDKTNNFPLLRHGHTASHPGLNYNCDEEKFDFEDNNIIKYDNIGCIDLTNWPGDSGAPIFIHNGGTHYNNGIHIGKCPSLIFIGIHMEGLTILDKGNQFDEEYEEHKCKDPELALGKYIKSYSVLYNMDWCQQK